MDSSHKNILKCLRKEIIADIDVNNGIILPLKTEFILNDNDVNRINAGANDEEKAEILLNILPRYIFTSLLIFII